MLLGDARSGKFADNIAGFGRSLRRAGVAVDVERISLAQSAARLIDLSSKAELSAAFESVFVSRESDRMVFRELFDAFFKDPNVGAKLLSQMLPTAEGRAEPSTQRARVREALAPQKAYGQTKKPERENELEFDAAMTASDLRGLRHADFNQLTASEYRLMQRTVQEVALPMPCVNGRRTRSSTRGARFDWRSALQSAGRHNGEIVRTPKRARRSEPLPLLILVDVSGSMERYSRMMLAFLHAATRQMNGRRVRRHVFAFGTQLTELTQSFKSGDVDAMLDACSAQITDFAGGTRLGECLTTLRERHARTLQGRRTVVLVISDGLDTGEGNTLATELAWLKRRCRRLLWLNPLLRFDGYAPIARGAAALHEAADGMLAVHNLAKLQDLAKSIQTVLKR